jgi:hypothetical protein
LKGAEYFYSKGGNPADIEPRPHQNSTLQNLVGNAGISPPWCPVMENHRRFSEIRGTAIENASGTFRKAMDCGRAYGSSLSGAEASDFSI